MNWVSIIQAVLQVLGPILSDLFKKWLSDKLTKTAKALPEPAEGSDPAANHAALLQAALDATPRRQVLRRAFLRHAAATVPAAIAAGQLDPADAKELAALAGSATGE